MIRDAEYVAWLYAALQEGWLTASMIESLAGEKFRGRGVKKAGIGGAIRRLLPAHSSAFPHRLKGDDLFAYKDGFWTVKKDTAAAQVQAAEAVQAA
ncbi:MAG TPA: hypothetical protein VKB92_13350 [Myxococcales bacterium]|nr:hypothetical protein [Myxococcales bacterium]